MATSIEFMDIMSAIQDEEDTRLGEFIRGFLDDVETGIERLDFAAYRDACAIREATSVLWRLAMDGYLADHIRSAYGEHTRWQEWHAGPGENDALTRSIRGVLHADGTALIASTLGAGAPPEQTTTAVLGRDAQLEGDGGRVAVYS